MINKAANLECNGTQASLFKKNFQAFVEFKTSMHLRLERKGLK
jgi:hypothetical protein